MRKLKLLGAVCALILGGGNFSFAQNWVDVTSLFLFNSDFEGSYSVQKTFQSGNNERCVYKPFGWTVTHENESTNDITILKSGDKQSASFKYFSLHPDNGGDQSYLVRFRWGGQYWDSNSNSKKGSVDKITLSQIQTIPSGTYRLSADLVYITSEESPSGWLRIYADKTAGGSLGYVDAETVKATRDGEAIKSGSATWNKKTTGEFTLDASTEAKFAIEYVQSWRWEVHAGADNYKLERSCPDGAYTIAAASSICSSTDYWSLKTGTYDNGSYAEHWVNDMPGTGDYLKYTLANVPNGTYTVKVTAKSSNTGSRDSNVTEVSNNGGTDYASIVVGGIEQSIPTWNALDAATGGLPQQYTFNNVLVNDGNLEVALKIKEVGPNWMIAKIDEIEFQGTYYYDYTIAKTAAETAIANSDYDNVIGTERADLNTQIEFSPSNASEYVSATAGLISKTETFILAKTNYDALVAEIIKAKALGIDDATADSYAATSSFTASEALTKTQSLKVAEYNFVSNTYKYGVDLGTWTTTGPTGSLKEQHYKGSGDPYSYLEQSSAAWGQSSWTIKYAQDLNLPAGSYVFKVAGRQAASDGVTLSLTVKNGETVLGTVNDFPRGDTGLGINKSGATDFTTGEGHEYVNDGNGRGWEWRYVKFTLASDATVNVSVDAVATESHMWVSFCDATVQTDNAANVSLIAYNIALASAQATIINDDYSNVTGSEKTALQEAIAADGELDKNDADAIDAATSTLNSAISAFTSAKSAYDAYVAAKAVEYEDNLPYASSSKFAAIGTAQATAAAASASDATTKTTAIISAYRKYVESNALAEGVTGAETITIPEYRFTDLTDENIDAANWKIGDHWYIDGQNNGSITFATGNTLMDGDGNNDYNYLRIQKSDNNAGIHQVVNLEPGKYLMTVSARCQSGQGAKFEAFAGEVNVSIPQSNNTGGQFDNGWNDVSVKFDVSEKSDITFGVKSDWGKNIWWNVTRFRLTKISDPIVINEEITYTPVESDDEIVTLARTIKKDTWNTFCVPFDISNDELKTAFGDDVEVAEFAETADGDNSSVSFTKMATAAITANTPVLLKTSTAGTSYTFTGRTIKAGDAKVEGTGNFDFVGCYDAQTYVTKGNYYLTNNYLYRSTSDNGTYVNGTRAYIKAKDNSSDARIGNFSIIDDTTEGIDNVKATSHQNGKTYNLNGQQVSKAQKGLYIQNGKKVVVK